MWYLWTALLVVSCALVSAGGAGERPTPATTRAPPRTLDRKADELAWRTWLQSPESNNQNSAPRRIITKSLFITPLVCPKGQRLDGKDCIVGMEVDKSEHERLLLNQLNAFFTASPSGDVAYDYGEDEPGPLQLSIPINLEAQAAPLLGQEPSAQAQELHGNFVKIDKKDNKKPDNGGSSLEAELELLQLQHSQHTHNDTSAEGILNHNVLLPFDKPKRDSPLDNSTEVIDNIDSGEGQKEVVYGHVNIDPVLLYTEPTTESETEQTTTTDAVNEQWSEAPAVLSNAITINNNASENKSIEVPTEAPTTSKISNSTSHTLKKEGDRTKLNPENDYADIGEAIKLISRYAEVTTDDNFSKDQKKYAIMDDSILGTRTKLQYRRNKPKPTVKVVRLPSRIVNSEKVPVRYGNGGVKPKNEVYYRYSWQGSNSPTPPPDYPFRHIQDYWPGQSHKGGVYSSGHENPRRHHHSYPYYFRPHSFPYGNYPGSYPREQHAYPGELKPIARRTIPVSHHGGPVRFQANNHDLYSLLGLRHWFSSEGTSKR